MKSKLYTVDRRERLSLNGKLVTWRYSKTSHLWTCAVNGAVTTHFLFGDMVKHVERETGVNYPW